MIVKCCKCFRNTRLFRCPHCSHDVCTSCKEQPRKSSTVRKPSTVVPKPFTIRPYTDVLRAQGGWILDYDSSGGGCRCRIFKKEVPHSGQKPPKWATKQHMKIERTYQMRRLELQIWNDGGEIWTDGHRISFFENGSMCTTPTSFKTPAEMVKAIEFETTRKQTRKDHHG